MYAEAAVTRAGVLIGAVTIACTLIAGNAAANDDIATVAVHVSAQGLDLTQGADAQTFYTRLKDAARLVCRVNLLPTDYPTRIRCYEQALGKAVQASDQPLLTQIYLRTHTLQQAASHGIEAAQLVAKCPGPVKGRMPHKRLSLC